MTVTQLNDAFTALVNQLQADGHNVGGHLMVAYEDHAVNKLKDRRNIWLVVVYPSKTYSGKPDAFKPHNTIMVFILEKDISDQTDGKELAQYQRLEDVLMATIGYIAAQQSEGCSLFDRFDPSSITVDPEYRTFGGWNGWSVTLSY